MHNAQRMVHQHQRKRIIICLVLGLVVVVATLAICFFLNKTTHRAERLTLQQQTRHALDTTLAPLMALQLPASLFTGSCPDASLKLREYVVARPSLRAVALVQNGEVGCSSLFGERHVPLNSRQPWFPSASVYIWLQQDKLLPQHDPVLAIWLPTSADGMSGSLQVVNISYLADLLWATQSDSGAKLAIDVGDTWFIHGQGLTQNLVPQPGESISTVQSSIPGISISLIGPSITRLAIRDLPSQLPLALLCSLFAVWAILITTTKRLSFIRELQTGIAGKEFVIYCQPLFNSATLKCTGVEILLRWDNPRQGPVSPETFIPIAEDVGQVASLTRYVLYETAIRTACFPEEADFHIGINVAAHHFQRGEILDDIKQYWSTQKPVQQLVMELTERDRLEDNDIQYIAAMKTLGVKLAIDDFGTGHSSLQRLEMLKPDILKIDKSFVTAIGSDAVNTPIIDLIVALGHRLHIDMIAEGIENHEQARYLREHGVSTLQGFLYGEPMPVEEFSEWLARYEQAGPSPAGE
ncbi:EAL domain-containing protein [Mangrovibacter plantisponsor]|uniref:cyclic-guanylate-specific phosphodiesterase n=1 Tax=Mangrovibacter plantisponsor TaxID=451513 RepID=A0A317PWZ9_9ENTR|nr:EAL domain-containing protein [Mangrovibacter plantisponsor]PWW07636.1 EAL domain-containing protein (putative c-di-GMP-specific phosphodiesterase class I) [Mangrovibacter plantisponsor]